MPQRSDPNLAQVLRRRWRLVLVVTCATAVVGYLGSLAMPKVYEAHASLLVGEFASGDVTINDIRGTQSLAATYADLARREPVMQAVVDDLRLKTPWRTLVSRVHVSIPREDPQVIDITVDDRTAARAERTAASVAKHVISVASGDATSEVSFIQKQLDALKTEIESVTSRLDSLRNQLPSAPTGTRAEIQSEIDALESRLTDQQKNYLQFRSMTTTPNSTAVRLLDSAYASPGPISPKVKFNTIIAAFLGLLAGFAAAYLLEARRRAGPRRPRAAAPAGQGWSTDEDVADGAERSDGAEPTGVGMSGGASGGWGGGLP